MKNEQVNKPASRYFFEWKLASREGGRWTSLRHESLNPNVKYVHFWPSSMGHYYYVVLLSLRITVKCVIGYSDESLGTSEETRMIYIYIKYYIQCFSPFTKYELTPKFFASIRYSFKLLFSEFLCILKDHIFN